MPFEEMKFKGKRVFVEVDSEGTPLVEKGRARMKYELDDDRIYNPNVGNLTHSDGSPVNAGAVPTAAGARKAVKEKRASSGRRVRAAASSPSPGSAAAIIAYTDGACSGNPGPAGLGFSIRFPDGRHVARGEPLGQATNNIAELTAILRVLESVDDPSKKLLIHTDSTYSMGVLTKGWKPKANQCLIARIKQVLGGFPKLEFVKVKGHAGVPENELVDELARTAAETQQIVEH